MINCFSAPLFEVLLRVECTLRAFFTRPVRKEPACWQPTRNFTTLLCALLFFDKIKLTHCNWYVNEPAGLGKNLRVIIAWQLISQPIVHFECEDDAGIHFLPHFGELILRYQFFSSKTNFWCTEKIFFEIDAFLFIETANFLEI